jgi:hypothetical protein
MEIMQWIRDIHAKKAALRPPVISFEFYPPKTARSTVQILRNLRLA